MKIAVGADHAGFSLTEERVPALSGLDLTKSCAPIDYPGYAGLIARAMAWSSAERGLVVCSTGRRGCAGTDRSVPSEEAARALSA